MDFAVVAGAKTTYCIKRLAGKFHLAIISDGPQKVQQNKIDALQLQKRFDRIILTDAWGPDFWKPHPRAFQEIERIWDYHSSACLYIADNAQKDFQAPRKLGWNTIQIRRPQGIYANNVPPTAAEPHYIINILDQADISS